MFHRNLFTRGDSLIRLGSALGEQIDALEQVHGAVELGIVGARYAFAVFFVKAFNSVGSALMVNPQLENGPPTMFICGNDEAAKQTVGEILDQFGWQTEDMGKIEAARAIEPLCILWCIPGFLQNDWVHAFKLLR